MADVACTANTLTCTLYALALLVWAALRAPLVAGDPLGAEWTWGLVLIAALTLLQRRLSFHIAVLRADQEFALTTELDVAEALASAVLTALGIWLAGFWGLLVAVGLLLSFKIVYLHVRHPLRFDWAWDWALAWRLMVEGMPIFACTAVFGFLLNVDQVLILWLVPDGARAAGLYSIALLGTSWSLDLAGRIVTVLYPHFQTTLGRTGDLRTVALAAVRATEAQAPILAAGSAVAAVVGPTFLGLLMPRYIAGLPALRPLLPGVLLLSLAWPARQMLITIDRPYRLGLATGLGLAATAALGALGAGRAGIVGVAWGVSLGYGITYLLTSLCGFLPLLGWRGWGRHQARLAGGMLWPAAGARGGDAAAGFVRAGDRGGLARGRPDGLAGAGTARVGSLLPTMARDVLTHRGTDARSCFRRPARGLVVRRRRTIAGGSARASRSQNRPRGAGLAAGSGRARDGRIGTG